MTGLLVFFLDHPIACVVGGFTVCLAAVYAVARIPEQTLLLDTDERHLHAVRDTSC